MAIPPVTTNNANTAGSSGTSNIGNSNKPAENPAAVRGSEWSYNSYQAPLFGGANRVTSADVVQDGSVIGDCYLLADLQMLANLNDDFIRNHVKEVPNPSDAQHPNYQVTLYREGKPFDVTVDGKQMLATEGGINVAAGAGVTAIGQGPSTSLWPAIYEKAYAVATGQSMEQMSLSSPTTAWSLLTGRLSASQRPDWPPGEFAQVSRRSQAHEEGLLISTKNIGTALGETDATGKQSLAGGRYSLTPDASGESVHVVDNESASRQSWDIPLNHILSVKSVQSMDSDHPDPNTVTDPNKLMVSLENPWGPSTTNIHNLQGVPYAVVQGLSKAFVRLQAPSTAT